jgi:hypothetical protein
MYNKYIKYIITGIIYPTEVENPVLIVITTVMYDADVVEAITSTTLVTRWRYMYQTFDDVTATLLLVLPVGLR